MEIELLGPLVVTRDDRPLGWAGPSPGCCSRCSPSTRAEWSGSTAWSTGSGERTCRQADALGAYQRARAVLAERAGLDPGPELRRLEAQLLAQDPALAIAPELSAAAPRATRPGGPAVRGPDAAPPEPGAAADVTARAPGATAAVVPSNLPAPLTSFVGREE